MTLHMLELRLDPLALAKFLDAQGLNRADDEDAGYGIHAWLAAAFGKQAPKPFRLLQQGSTPPRLLAYTSSDPSELVDHHASFAVPLAAAVADVRFSMQEAKRMPTDWSPGRILGFEVLACPVARKSQSGIEKDLFLQRLDCAEPTKVPRREVVYSEWLQSQLANACSLQSSILAAFSLVHQVRRAPPQRSERRRIVRLTRPQALLRGTLRIENGARFQKLLQSGLGRHRAFGYGMLLLKPAR